MVIEEILLVLIAIMFVPVLIIFIVLFIILPVGLFSELLAIIFRCLFKPAKVRCKVCGKECKENFCSGKCYRLADEEFVEF